MMTDAPTIPEGFTAHDGGPCPVHPDTVVEVILGIGREYQSASAEYFFWLECGRYSVIAYKVITPYVEPTDWQEIAEELAEALEVYGNGIGHSEIEDGGDIASQALAKYNAAKEQST